MFNFKKKPSSSAPTTEQPEAHQPQPETQENPEAGSVSSDNQPDWDSAPIPAAEVAQEAPAPEMEGHGPQVITATPEGEKYVIPYEIFHDGFVKSFQLAGHVTQLKTLVAAGDEKTCPDATRAIYDIIIETPALHFLIKPGSIWVQRAFAIGSFVVPVAMGVAGELRARQMEVAA